MLKVLCNAYVAYGPDDCAIAEQPFSTWPLLGRIGYNGKFMAEFHQAYLECAPTKKQWHECHMKRRMATRLPVSSKDAGSQLMLR